MKPEMKKKEVGNILQHSSALFNNNTVLYFVTVTTLSSIILSFVQLSSSIIKKDVFVVQESWKHPTLPLKPIYARVQSYTLVNVINM